MHSRVELFRNSKTAVLCKTVSELSEEVQEVLGGIVNLFQVECRLTAS